MGSTPIRAAVQSERGEGWSSRQFGELEIVGSNPTVLTQNGDGRRGLVAHARLITEPR